MKKVISILLVAVMLSATLSAVTSASAVNASADAVAEFNISTLSFDEKTLCIAVDLTDNSGIFSLCMDLFYNREALQFVGVDSSESQFELVTPNGNINPMVLYFEAKEVENFDYNRNIAVLRFNIIDVTKSFGFSVSCDQQNTIKLDGDFTHFEVPDVLDANIDIVNNLTENCLPDDLGKFAESVMSFDANGFSQEKYTEAKNIVHSNSFLFTWLYQDEYRLMIEAVYPGFLAKYAEIYKLFTDNYLANEKGDLSDIDFLVKRVNNAGEHTAFDNDFLNSECLSIFKLLSTLSDEQVKYVKAHTGPIDFSIVLERIVRNCAAEAGLSSADFDTIFTLIYNLPEYSQMTDSDEVNLVALEQMIKQCNENDLAFIRIESINSAADSNETITAYDRYLASIAAYNASVKPTTPPTTTTTTTPTVTQPIQQAQSPQTGDALTVILIAAALSVASCTAIVVLRKKHN